MAKREKLNDNEVLDTSTGEVIRTDRNPKDGFIKLFDEAWYELSDMLGPKFKVWAFLCQKMNYNNIVTKTQQQIADELGISRRYANQILNEYQDMGFLQMKRNFIIVNPYKAFRGSGAIQGRARSNYGRIAEKRLSKELKDIENAE